MSAGILIVEDDARTRKTIEGLCVGHRHFADADIRHAENGLDAWQQMQAARPDAMFLDMEMPGMNGLELLTLMKEKGIFVHIVVISGYDSYPYTRKALQYGTVDYLLKPIDRKQMGTVLDCLWLRLCAPRESSSLHALPASPENHSPMDALKQYIDTYYAQPLSLTELAERFHYNRDYVSREFKNRYGIGLVHYINEVRLERARILLEQDLPVKEVCTKVGFYDDSYFIRIFKQKFGQSPGRYGAK